MIAALQQAAGFGCRGQEQACRWARYVAHGPTDLPMPPQRRAFTLMELMIGIVILGLGMVMVATIFPVAWTRARTLSEYTVQRAITQGAHPTVMSLVRVSRPSVGIGPSIADASSFLGDLICDPGNPFAPISACGAYFPSDTWVHALNLENVQVANRQFIREDLWEVEARWFTPVVLADLPPEIVDNSFFRNKQVSFLQRIYPPMEPRENVNVDGVFVGNDERWDDALGTRRFSWALFHRLRDPLGHCSTPEVRSRIRSFDLYYVTLRRPRPTYRYARQDSTDPASVPDACELEETTNIVPAAMGPQNDLMFPVPWRVQLEFPGTLLPRGNPTGIPTEVVVPPDSLTAGTPIQKAMLVQMFPTGGRFIDELTGGVFRVVKRRVTGDAADSAVLTLDREAFIEDLDLEAINTALCVGCIAENGATEPAELLRTVWVFPPPVQATRGPGDVPIFEGSQPVVGIDVRTLNIAPTR